MNVHQAGTAPKKSEVLYLSNDGQMKMFESGQPARGKGDEPFDVLSNQFSSFSVTRYLSDDSASPVESRICLQWSCSERSRLSFAKKWYSQLRTRPETVTIVDVIKARVL